MKLLVELVIRRRVAVLMATALVTAGLLVQMKNLSVIIDPNNFLPASHPFVKSTNQVEKIFGSKYVLLIGLTSATADGEALRPEILDKVQRITAGLAGVPYVVKENILSLSARKAKNIIGTDDGLEVRPLMETIPRSPEDIESLKKALRANPAYFNTIVSHDWKTVAVLAEFRDPPKGFGAIMSEVAPIVDKERDASVQITLGGLPVFLSRTEYFSQRMAFLFPIAVVIIGLIHYEAFRTRQAAFLPLVTALLAVIWGLGIMGIFGVPMDVFNATTPILILAVAAGHAVQILKRYYEEYHRLRETTTLSPHEANRAAVVQSIMRVGPVMLTAGIAAILGFLSLVVFEISAVRTFGVFTALGLMSALVLELTFIPALRSLLPPPGDRERFRERERRFWDRLTAHFADWVVVGARRRMVLVGAAVLMLIAIVGASRVQVRQQVKREFSTSLGFVKDDQALNERLGGTNAVYLLVEGKQPGAIKRPEVLRAMEAAQRQLEREPNVGKTLSIVDFMKRMNRAMHGDDPAWDKLPDTEELISQYLLLYSLSGEPGDFDTYVDYDYRSANIWAFTKSSDSAGFARLVANITPLIEKQFGPDVTVGIGGSVAQESALAEVMVRSKMLNMMQIGGVILIISAIVFRSLLAGVLVVIPLIMTVLMNFGMMGFTGIPLNIANALTSAMVVGIGADYAIYLIFRLREELARTTDETEAVRGTLATAGKATLFVASAVAGGYGVLVFSFGFYLHIWMAIMIATAMIVSGVAALTILPALLLSIRPRFVFAASAVEASRVARATAGVLLAAAVSATSLTGDRGALAQAPSNQRDAVEIMRRNFVVSRVQDSTQNTVITLTNKGGQQRVRKTTGATKLDVNGIDNMRVVRFSSPPDVEGTATLLLEHSASDDDIWIYLPALRKVRRIVSANKKESFVGTDFSYGDVIGHKVDDWTHTRLREETVDGQACHVIESVPKNDAVRDSSGYSKMVSWIRADNFVMVKGEYWDRGGQPLKRAQFSDIQLVDRDRGKWQAMHLEASNLQTGHRTVIEFQEFRANQQVPRDYFTTRYLER